MPKKIRIPQINTFIQFPNDNSSKSKAQQTPKNAPHHVRIIVVVSTGQCVLVVERMIPPLLSALRSRERTGGKRALTCECSAKGGPGSVLFSTDGRHGGGKRVCACLCVLAGGCGGVLECVLPLSVNK